MPNLFDFDNGNGNYDVVTRADYDRRHQEIIKRSEKRRRAQATPEELADPYFDVPYMNKYFDDEY